MKAGWYTVTTPLTMNVSLCLGTLVKDKRGIQRHNKGNGNKRQTISISCKI